MTLPTAKPPLGFWRRPQSEAPLETVVAARPPEPALQVILQIGEMPARPLMVAISQRLVLGRSGAEGEGEGPDLDLTPFGAAHAGVSRRHAALVHQENALYVEDLSSLNGTRLNGLPLGRGARFRLRNNDELELGTLRVVVRAAPQPR